MSSGMGWILDNPYTLVERLGIAQSLGTSIEEVELLAHGQIGEVYKLTTPKETFVLKVTESTNALQIETKMLRDMQGHDIAVPDVIGVSWPNEQPAFMVMEYIEPHHYTQTEQEQMAAKLLCKLHRVTNDARMYGYWYDTTIGPFPQHNEQTQYNWGLFLGEMRIMPMARICYEKGLLSKTMFQGLETLSRDLYRHLNLLSITPSLIHGDLWQGNLCFGKEGAVLIDPALYFADREMELAFLRMFNTFGETFWQTYTEEFPLSKSFEEVKLPLYQIYPQLVHAALYGPHYLSSLPAVLKRFA